MIKKLIFLITLCLFTLEGYALDNYDISKIENLGWRFGGYYKDDSGKELKDDPMLTYGFDAKSDELYDKQLQMILNVGSLWFYSTQVPYEENLDKISITDQVGKTILTKNIDKVHKDKVLQMTGGGVIDTMKYFEIIKAIDKNPNGLLRLHFTNKTIYIPLKDHRGLQNLILVAKYGLNYDIYQYL